MLLLVGLGNPGSEYERNRHNIGFMAVEEIARRYNFGPWKKKFQGRMCEGTIDGEKVLALQPFTYMNDSGQSVVAAMTFYKLKPEQIVVLHDELDLPTAKLRVKKGGGHGGHNGLRSIDAHVGKEYWRIRIGIGHPGDKNAVTGWVLHDFSKTEMTLLDPLLTTIADTLPLIVAGRPDEFMNKVALATK